MRSFRVKRTIRDRLTDANIFEAYSDRGWGKYLWVGYEFFHYDSYRFDDSDRMRANKRILKYRESLRAKHG